jgi:hypothetical protein
MTPTLRNTVLIVVLALVAPSVAAQTVPPGNPWNRGTTLNVFVGANRASSELGPAAGGALGWELWPWLGVEGSAGWLDRPGRAHAFAAELKALVGLPRLRPVVPFVEGGVGLYRATFDRAAPGIPAFYRGRVRSGTSLSQGLASVTDPSLVVGGGANVYLNRHIAIRPEMEARIVLHDSQRHVVTSMAVRFAYHFEEHPITPAR